jgi:membrane protein implicated in regulation of membrane protease activity
LIKHTNNSDQVTSVIKVPLAYGPTQKFLARLEQSPDLNKSTAITLPRMSFEFTGLTYDPGRKVSTTQTFTAKDPEDGSETKKAYMPVPYNMQFELSIMSKLNDDALQIIEQILPYFQPSYNLTVELLESIGEKRDVPVVLENITMQDDYEGNFTTRRVLLYTLRFTVKTYLFGPVSSATKDIVKKVTLNYLTGTNTENTSREVVFSAEPRAIKNYTGIVLTNLSKDISTTDTLITVDNSSSISTNTYLDIEGEEVYVKLKSGNTLTVERGRDGTTITSHLAGAEVKSITVSDNELIEDGDDFGFSGTTF